MRPRSPTFLAGLLLAGVAAAQDLTSASLGVVYDLDDANSGSIARYYVAKRGIPLENILGVHAGHADVVSPEAFASLRRDVLDRLPTAAAIAGHRVVATVRGGLHVRYQRHGGWLSGGLLRARVRCDAEQSAVR